MTEFKSPGAFLDFSSSLKIESRYILSYKHQRFIKVLMSCLEKRIRSIPEGTIYYRARLGSVPRKVANSSRRERYPYSKKDMEAPPENSAVEGRMNPKGISYLYLSSDKDTAVAETRPWLTQEVSVATCTLTVPLKVIDLTLKDIDPSVCSPWEESPTEEEKEKRILYDVKNAFGKPVLITESNTDYVATQYLAEIIKSQGYHGILFRSSLSQSGHNLVVFNPYLISIGQRKLYSVEGLSYEIRSYKNY